MSAEDFIRFVGGGYDAAEAARGRLRRVLELVQEKEGVSLEAAFGALDKVRSSSALGALEESAERGARRGYLRVTRENHTASRAVLRPLRGAIDEDAELRWIVLGRGTLGPAAPAHRFSHKRRMLSMASPRIARFISRWGCSPIPCSRGKGGASSEENASPPVTVEPARGKSPRRRRRRGRRSSCVSSPVMRPIRQIREPADVVSRHWHHHPGVTTVPQASPPRDRHPPVIAKCSSVITSPYHRLGGRGPAPASI